MYVLFAVLTSVVLYSALVMALRLVQRGPDRPRAVALGTLAVLAVALVAFNIASRAAGIDIGPGRAVSYSIPSDYLNKGMLGTLALAIYFIACSSPAFAFALLRGRR